MRRPRPSAPRNNRYARKWHAALIAQLGGRCAWCSATTRLELDHKNGRTWIPRAVKALKRIAEALGALTMMFARWELDRTQRRRRAK